jgi:hypothetical protein
MLKNGFFIDIRNIVKNFIALYKKTKNLIKLFADYLISKQNIIKAK